MTINENQNTINRKIMLISAGLTVRSLAERIGYTPQAVNTSIIGQSTSYRCHARIASVLGKPMVEIWPELYAVIPANQKEGDIRG